MAFTFPFRVNLIRGGLSILLTVPLSVAEGATGPAQNGDDTIGRSLQSTFIWSPSAPVGKEAYVAFRRSFTIPEAPTSPMLHVFADSRYLLWVNGEYVLRGPCRFNPTRPEYDSVDIGGRLRKGANTLVVLVHHYAGAINGRIIQHAPGLTVRLEASGKELLHTDTSWQCSGNTEYRPSGSAWSSIPDVLDARVNPGEWTATAFEGSGWQQGVAVDGGAWGGLHRRELPLPRETELTDLRLRPTGQTLKESLPIELARRQGGGRGLAPHGHGVRGCGPGRGGRKRAANAVCLAL